MGTRQNNQYNLPATLDIGRVLLDYLNIEIEEGLLTLSYVNGYSKSKNMKKSIYFHKLPL